ncbi:MAG: anti-sigma factor [Vicinamibacterales bacterium]
MTPCPDLETLAALVDQGLGGAERAAVLSHLLGCGECRSLVAQVLRTQDAVSGVPGAKGAPGPGFASESLSPRQRWWTAAGALLILASPLVVLAVASRRSGTETGDAAGLAGLAAVVEERRTERLHPGVGFGLRRAPVRSGGSTAAAAKATPLITAGRARGTTRRTRPRFVPVY